MKFNYQLITEIKRKNSEEAETIRTSYATFEKARESAALREGIQNLAGYSISQQIIFDKRTGDVLYHRGRTK